MKAAKDEGTQASLDKRLLKVLLVEDEATDRMSVERILRTCSSPVEFVVESAVNLSEAIRNLAEKKYDVILLDLELPDSGGIETLRQMVKVAPDIPVVALTELNDEQTGFLALEDGATDYLVKDLPLNVVLVRTIIYALHRKKIQVQSLKLMHDINERIKELNCLYGISKLVEAPGISLEEILEKTVCLIPAGWQYPSITCARIVLEGKEYKTDNFKPSKWTQSVDIKLQGQKVGTVEVCYMEERPRSDEGPFLREERNLIDAIGERLGKMAERIKGEEMLRESEERYHLLFENSQDAMMTIVPPSWKFVLGNPAAFEMFGVKDAAEFAALGPWDVSPERQPDGRLSTDKAREMIETAMRKGFHFFEWTHKRLSGENFSSTVLLTSMEMAGQKLIQATVRDITERKKAQQRIEDARTYAENIVETMRAPLIVLGTDLKVISANNAFYQTFKVNRKETEGRFIYDLGNRQWNIPKLRQLLEEILPKNNTFDNYEIEHNFETIGLKTMLFNARRLDSVQMILINIEDITERKNKEKLILDANRRLEEVSGKLSAAKRDLEQKNEALQKAGSELEERVKERTAELAAANKVLGVMQQNMQTVIKHSTDGLLIVDDNKIVLFMNLAAEVILGQRAQDLLGEPFGLPLTTDKPSEIQLTAADGSVTIAEVQAVQTEWENGPVYMATIRDITLLKKAQQETEAANEQLRRFNDLKDEFVSMASHELRTPLSIISGAVKLLTDEIPGKIVSGQKEILDMAMKNLDRLARIVDALLNISKIESGKIELYRTDADISHLIAETVNEYSPQAEEKHIDLSCQLPAHPVILCADADRIKEVIANLISNSTKFTPEGGSINVCCEDRNDDVLIFVKDTGCGVAKKDVPRMFEKFMQFDRKVGPGEKGTGLGLAICKGLVNLHNGKIWAESDTGSGMKISFTIPRLSAEHIFTESVDNAVKSSLKAGGGAAVVLVSTKPLIQIDTPQMQAILKDVSGVLEQNLRRNALNTVIQGTKEVLVVLGNCDITGASSVCQRLTQAIEGHLADKGLSSKLDLLIGYAAYPDDGQTGQSLIEKAREAVVACLPSNKA